MTTKPPEAERGIEERQIRSDWQEFWYKESKNTEQSYLTPDTHGIVIDYLKELYKSHHQELQKAREEERERIEAIFKEHVPPHAMDLEDSVWLKRLLNKAFNHDKNV